MTNIFRKAHGTCEVHGKKSYPSKDLAKKAVQEMHDPGMREYRCDDNDGYWHIGHLPPAVRNGDTTIAEFRDSGPGRLTFKPSPVNLKPLNGKAHAPVTLADNSIESLLAAAEASGNDVARNMAAQIRKLLVELIDEIRVGEKKRQLEELVAERQRLLDEAMRQLQELHAPAAPEPVGQAERNYSGQSDIRTWARENGFEVKSIGAIPQRVREAYAQAHGGAA